MYRLLSIRRRAFTLPEIIVSLFLTLLLLTLLVSFLVPCLRATQTGTIRVELQQESLLALGRVMADLESTVTAAITVQASGSSPETGPVYLAVIPVESVNSDGLQVWKQSIVLYYWKEAGSPLIRKEWTPSSPPSLGLVSGDIKPTVVTNAMMSQIASETALRGKILARDVKEFRVKSLTTSLSLSSPIEVFISLERRGGTGKKDAEKFSLARNVTLRNEL
ncbi:MAG: hypothetical protein RDV48_25145 [Candidatus Eremiobacteraeota bacterium]|nr:hypothetical protein [Candidatus Eremiobacteraeota bacterium]